MKKEYDFRKGRRGAVLPQKKKTRITIFIDSEVLQEFRQRADASGRGYQTLMNEVLREYLGKAKKLLDARTVRRIIREELDRAG